MKTQFFRFHFIRDDKMRDQALNPKRLMLLFVTVLLTYGVESISYGEVCEAGDILAPGESCTYPGTDTEFSVLGSGRGKFGFFTSGNNLNIRNTVINGQSYTLVANKLASGSWKIEEIADSAAPKTTNTAPTFTDGVSTTRSVAENTAAGVHIGTPVAATDADNDTLTYTLGGTDTASFIIDVTTGQLKTKAALDYETKSTYTVTITASDGSLTDTIAVTINVTDVNETPANRAPVFTAGASTTRSVAENTATGQNIGTAITATDADNDTLTYTLGGTNAASFGINGSTGQLQTKAALDYETKSTYTVTVGVSDGTLTDSITVTINITDVNEIPANRAPVFTEGATTTRTVELPPKPENPGDMDIGTPLFATDADGDFLRYTLGGADAALFHTYAFSTYLTYTTPGVQLTTRGGSLYDGTKSSYTVTVTASDGSLTDTITVTINVTAVNETPAATGVCQVGDVLAPGESCTYPGTNTEFSVLSDGRGQFGFFTSGSSLNIRNTTINNQSYTLVAQKLASGSWEIEELADSGTTSTPTNTAPTFTDGSSTTRSVAENTAAGAHIGAAIAATDADNDTLTYTLGGTDAASFVIDATTGQLKTKATLDYETKRTYTVTVTVSDGSLTDTITVTINVTDVNETPTNRAPAFTEGTSTTRSVAENTAAGAHIGAAIAATDADNDTLTYTLGGTDAASFVIDATTGQLKTKTALNDETKTTYTMTITVSDGSLTDTITVTINITDVADTPGVSGFTPVCDRTPQVRDGIVASVPGVSDCNDVTEVHLAAITTLNLNSTNITALKSGDFDGLSSLQVLRLEHNQLRALPSDIFSGLSSLRSLFLGNNQLTRLPVDVFSGLSALKHIYLHQNQLGSLPADVFSGLTSLLQINIHTNQLTNLPADVFSGLPSLLQIYLRNNRLTNLSPKLFSGLSSLQHLYLDGNRLTTVPAGIFSGLSSLTQLLLNDNQMSTLSREMFRGLTASTWLWLQGNTVDPLPLTVSLEKVGVNQFKATVPAGAPFTITIPISVVNGTISGGVSTLTIPQGSVESGRLTVTRTAGTTAAVTVDIGTLPGLPTNHQGYQLAKPISPPLEIISGPGNSAPVFIEGTSTTRSVAENTAPGKHIGTAVTATDADNDTPTYTLGGTDAADFIIDATTGQLKTSAPLDYETKRTYTVTVTVSDGSLTDTITVTINVTDVNETSANRAPAFTEGTSTSRSVAENIAPGKHIGTAVTATDADNDTLTYTLGGTDAADFIIDATTGQLKTSAPLDYETKRTYTVTVSVSDGNGGSDTINVTINVTDIDESLTDTGVCKVGDILAPGESCTYPGTDATFSVLNNGHARWNIPGLPSWLSWANQVSIGGSLSFSATINDDDYHFVAEEVPNNSWEIKEIGGDRPQQPETPEQPEQPGDTGTTPTLTASTTSPLTEATLNESVVTLTLSGGTYERSSFSVARVIEVSGINGVTFNTWDVDRVSDTQVTVELTFNGDFDTNATLIFTVGAGAIADYDGTALTAQIPVTGGPESVVASTDAPLTEATLHESVVTLTLRGRTYVDSSYNVARAITVSGINGVTFNTWDVDRVSDTQVTVELTFNGNFDTNSTLTFTVGAGAIGGPALTAQVSVSASTEVPADTGIQDPEEEEPPAAQDYIQGPWLWMIASGADIDTDYLAVESGGTITEAQVAQNGVNEGDYLGELQWTRGQIYPSTHISFWGIRYSNNVNHVVNAIGLTTDDNLNYYSAYALINIISTHDQNDIQMGVGSDDAIKVWLNGTVVHRNDVDRRTSGIQDRFRVNLKAGNNLLLVKVSDNWGNWGMFFKIYLDEADFTTAIPKAKTDSQFPDTPQPPVTTNTAPTFTNGASTTRTIAENTAAGIHIGRPVVATDADNDTLTYTLGGTNAAAFNIDATTGQLKTRAALDYETKRSYTVTATVSDGSLTDTITVTINITDIAETPTPQQPQQPEGGTPTLRASTTAPLTEATLHESVVTLTLSGVTYVDSSFRVARAITVSGIDGVTFNTWDVDDISDTVVTVELTFNGDFDTNATLIFTMGAGAIADYDGTALTAQIPVTGGPESVVASTDAPLTEATLHESVVTLTLSGRTYVDSSFNVTRAIEVSGIDGVTFNTWDVDRISDTVVEVELTFNGDFDTNSTLTFIVGAGAIGGPALTAQVPVAGGTESLVASTTAPLTEATLDESVVTLTLSGRNFESSNFRVRGAVTVSGIAGVTVRSFDIDRVSDTQIIVELTFDGTNFDTDATLTFTVGAEAIAGYNGTALTAQVTVTATQQVLRAPSGISLIHVPLRVTAVNGVAQTIELVGDLYDALGGADAVNLLITYNPKTQGWLSYLGEYSRGTAADTVLADHQGVITDMKTSVSLQLDGDALGSNGSSSITLHPGTNLVGMSLKDPRITRVSDLFALEGIRDNASTITVLNNGTFQTVGQVDDAGDIPITGGQSFILSVREAATVTISGQGWDNVSGIAAAAPVGLTGIEVGNTTPVLALTGSIVSPDRIRPGSGFRVIVKNLSTRKSVVTTTEETGDSYQLTVVDTETGRAAQIGDILEISVRSPDPRIGVQPLRHTVTAEDVKRSRVELDNLVVYEIPTETELLPNFPNPFNPETWIPYRLAEDAFVTLTIYDTAGGVVRSIDVGYKSAAVYKSKAKAIHWNGRNEFGEQVASGVYFYHLSAGDYSATRKMLILK